MGQMDEITTFLAKAEDWRELRQVLDLYVLPAIMRGTRPRIRLTDSALTEELSAHPDLVWLLGGSEGSDYAAMSEQGSAEETDEEDGSDGGDIYDAEEDRREEEEEEESSDERGSDNGQEERGDTRRAEEGDWGSAGHVSEILLTDEEDEYPFLRNDRMDVDVTK